MATTNGKISVALVDGAGKEWSGPQVRVTLRDPFTSSNNKILKDVNIAKGKSGVIIEGVPADAGQRYMLFVDADGHRSHSVFPVKPRPNTVVTKKMMLVRNNPEPDFSSFTFKRLRAASPEFHQALSRNITEEIFLGLADADAKFGRARIAALLNIEAKLRATTLKEGNAATYVKLVEKIECCEPDRVKAFVDPKMPKHVDSHDDFSELNEDLNEMNHKGFPVSFKEKVPFGSLQLSFAKTPGENGLDADIDIDLFTDIGHFGEVIKNKVTKMKTDPFTVYVLLFDQGISPLYTLKV